VRGSHRFPPLPWPLAIRAIERAAAKPPCFRLPSCRPSRRSAPIWSALGQLYRFLAYVFLAVEPPRRPRHTAQHAQRRAQRHDPTGMMPRLPAAGEAHAEPFGAYGGTPPQPPPRRTSKSQPAPRGGALRKRPPTPCTALRDVLGRMRSPLLKPALRPSGSPAGNTEMFPPRSLQPTGLHRRRECASDAPLPSARHLTRACACAGEREPFAAEDARCAHRRRMKRPMPRRRARNNPRTRSPNSLACRCSQIPSTEDDKPPTCWPTTTNGQPSYLWVICVLPCGYQRPCDQQ